MKLAPVEAARERMLAACAPLGAETVPLAAAAGRVLAEDVRAGRDQPPFDASAMDGWAVRAAETPGRLAIAGESAAGRAFEGAMPKGAAVRIFTGAPIPAEADAIVIQEDATRDGDLVEVPKTEAGTYVRRRGLDFAAGAALLQAGQRLDPWRLALAASSGRAEIAVARRPRVLLLSTGEELAAAGSTPGPYQIFDSGGPAVIALAESVGATAERQVAGDDMDALLAKLDGVSADLIVTIGGASVGDHDLVRQAGRRLGLTLAVESLAMRPGKPTFFGTFEDGRRWLGLPGNPASAMACAELFLKPILRALQGEPPGPALARARTTQPLAANGPREHWMRAVLGEDAAGRTATPLGDQDSSLVSVFAAADALLRRPADAAAAAAGDPVEVLPLPRA
ncbi:MAG: molybdopterin molybdotransferase MoeA [Caulobacteraceae bacterium]|nr:molybdopterin molybdotransferase MoeA [Caulobacteraceae bacterium]